MKLLVDRPRVVDALLEEPQKGSQAPDASASPSTYLDAFVTWLWPMTGGSERYCRSWPSACRLFKLTFSSNRLQESL